MRRAKPYSKEPVDGAPPDVPHDPIAAAMQAREERLRLAAQAAARAVPADVTTTLSAERAPGVRGFRAPPAPRFAQETPGQLPGAASQSDHDATSSEDTSAPNSTLEQRKVASNPSSGQEAQASPNALASLLGYSDALSEDEPSGEEDAEHAHHTAIHPGQSGAAKGSLSGASSTTAAAVLDGSGDSLDLELASFMEELQSSGLLADTEANAAEHAAIDSASVPPASAPSPASLITHQPLHAPLATTPEMNTPDHSPDQHLDPTTMATPSTQAAASADKSPTSDTLTEVAAAGTVSLAVLDESGASLGDTNGGREGDEEPESEQVLLGYLSQAPLWSKCLDSASGKVYYWHLETNDVVWEVPAGLDPDLLLLPDAAVQAAAVAEAGSHADSAVAQQQQLAGAAVLPALAGGSMITPGQEPRGNAVGSLSGANAFTPMDCSSEQSAASASDRTPCVSNTSLQNDTSMSTAGADAPLHTTIASPGLGLSQYEAEADSDLEDGELQMVVTEPVISQDTASVPNGGELNDLQASVNTTAGRAASNPSAKAGLPASHPPFFSHPASQSAAVAAASTAVAAANFPSDPTAASSAQNKFATSAAWTQHQHPANPLLQQPQSQVGHALYELSTELYAAAASFMSQLPPLVQLAVEAQVRVADWRLLAARQAEAVTQNLTSSAHTWEQYERHVCASINSLREAFPAAVQGAREHGYSASGSYPTGWGSSAGTSLHATEAFLDEGEARPKKMSRRGDTAADAAAVAAHSSGVAYTPAQQAYAWRLQQQQQYAQQGYGYSPEQLAAYYAASGHHAYASSLATSSSSEPGTGSSSLPPLPSVSGGSPHPAPGTEDWGPPPSSPPPPLPGAAPSLPPQPSESAPGCSSEDMDGSSSEDMALDDSDNAPTVVITPSATYPQHFLGLDTAVPPWPESQDSIALHPAGGAPDADSGAALPAHTESAMYSLPGVPSVADVQQQTYDPHTSQREAGNLVYEPPPSYISVAHAAGSLAHVGVIGVTPQEQPTQQHQSAAAAATRRKGTTDSGIAKPGKKGKASAVSSISSKAPGSSKMSVLLSQWSTARKTLEDEEEKAEQAIAETTDPVAMERKRERELQAWKQRQLESGQAAENANFQPIGDWRSRFPAAQQKQAAVPTAPSPPLPSSDFPAPTSIPAPTATAQLPHTSFSTPTIPTKTSKPKSNHSKDPALTKESSTPLAASTGKGSTKAKEVSSGSKDVLSSSSKLKRASGSAAVASRSKPVFPTNSSTRPDLEDLSRSLPPGWRAMWDKNTGDIYYGNLATRATSWERPS